MGWSTIWMAFNEEDFEKNELLPWFQKKAMEALQYAAESYLVKLYEDVNLLARHAKHITVYVKDLLLVRHIREEIE